MNNYRALKAIAGVQKVVAVLFWLCMFFAVPALIKSVPASADPLNSSYAGYIFAVAIGWILAFLFLGTWAWAGAEIIQLFINIEVNTRKPSVRAVAASS